MLTKVTNLCLNRNPVDLIEGDVVAGAVVEFGGFGAFVVGYSLGVLDRAAVFQVGRDAGRPEHVVADRGGKPVGVFVSRDEYQHLQGLDYAYWIARAEAAEKVGRWLGHDEAMRILMEKLKPDA